MPRLSSTMETLIRMQSPGITVREVRKGSNRTNVRCARSVPDGTPRFLFGGLAGFIGQHSFFGAAAATALLPADFLDAGAFGFDEAFLASLDFVQEKAARDESVKALLTGGLRFDLQTSRSMKEHDAGSGFVDVLAAMAARANEGFFKVGLAHPEGAHALRQLGFFFGTDREGAHEGKLASRR